MRKIHLDPHSEYSDGARDWASEVRRRKAQRNLPVGVPVGGGRLDLLETSDL